MKLGRILGGRRGPAVVVAGWLGAAVLWAQAAGTGDTIGGIVINSVTREPVARALVESPDERFATLTNSEGRFEFTVPKGGQNGAGQPGDERSGASDAEGVVPGVTANLATNLPNALVARKPGYLQGFYQPLELNHESGDLTIELTPEALIVGSVRLASGEFSDTITLELFRREVQEGRERYVMAGIGQSRSDGEFRFAGLRAGTYKLLTDELLDRDPLTFDAGRALFGYPPVYYPNAPDFESAGTIEVSGGQTQTVILSLVKQPYYRVKVPVTAAGGGAADRVNVSVFAHGRRGPGYSLGYLRSEHAIRGLLPSGTYVIEAVDFGPTGETSAGVQTIAVKGAAAEGPGLTIVPSAAIPVNVKEEFTGADPIGRTTWNVNGRNVVVKGPRRYLNVVLDPAGETGLQRPATLRDPIGSADEPLMITGPPPGSYWVRVNTSRGYAATVRSGNLDLQHQPLVVGVGGGVSPIEITMRDETGEISGKVEGMPAEQRAGAGTALPEGMTFHAPPNAPQGAWLPRALLYCVPVADSSGQFRQISVNPDGSFDDAGLVPGAYRLLAFDREQPELEYRSPEAMRAYDSKGPVANVAAGQKVQVTLQLISTQNTSH